MHIISFRSPHRFPAPYRFTPQPHHIAEREKDGTSSIVSSIRPASPPRRKRRFRRPSDYFSQRQVQYCCPFRHYGTEPSRAAPYSLPQPNAEFAIVCVSSDDGRRTVVSACFFFWTGPATVASNDTLLAALMIANLLFRRSRPEDQFTVRRSFPLLAYSMSIVRTERTRWRENDWRSHRRNPGELLTSGRRLVSGSSPHSNLVAETL